MTQARQIKLNLMDNTKYISAFLLIYSDKLFK